MYYECLEVTTYRCLESRQVSNLNYGQIQRLIFASSAPEESPPPPPRNTHETVSDVHRDVMKAEAIISEVQRDVAKTQATVREMLNQDQSVSDTCALLAT